MWLETGGTEKVYTAVWVGVPLGWRTASSVQALVGGAARFAEIGKQRRRMVEREVRLFGESLGCGVTLVGKHLKHVPASRLNVESPSAMGGATFVRYSA